METSPAAMGELFEVPALAIRVGEQYELFEDQFAEIDWRIADRDPLLGEKEFALPAGLSKAALVDVDAKGKLETSFIEDIQRQLALFERGPADAAGFAVWLARNVTALDLTHEDKLAFLLKAVKGLLDLRGYTLEQLLSARFRLADAAAAKIDNHRKAALRGSFEQFLLPECQTPIEITPAVVFKFPRESYAANRLYEGPYVFRKHYYSTPAAMNKEEADCAQILDQHPKVKFWVRNLQNRPNHAFTLRMPTGYHYPDFVGVLVDGRYLVVEYKGAHLAETPETLMKMTVGKLWERRSNGGCLYRMVTKATMRSMLDGL